MSNLIKLDDFANKFHMNAQGIYLEKENGVFLFEYSSQYKIYLYNKSCYHSIVNDSFFIFQEENGKEVYIFNQNNNRWLATSSKFYLGRNKLLEYKIFLPSIQQKELCILDLLSLEIDFTPFVRLPLASTESISLFELDNGKTFAYDIVEKKEKWRLDKSFFGIPNDSILNYLVFSASYGDLLIMTFSLGALFCSTCIDSISGEVLWVRPKSRIRAFDQNKGLVFYFSFNFPSRLIITEVRTGEEILDIEWEDRNKLINLPLIPDQFYEVSEDKIVITDLADFPSETFIFDYSGKLVETIHHGEKSLKSKAKLKHGNLYIHYDEDQTKGQLSYHESIF